MCIRDSFETGQSLLSKIDNIDLGGAGGLILDVSGKLVETGLLLLEQIEDVSISGDFVTHPEAIAYAIVFG